MAGTNVSLPDVAEELMHEFDGVFAASRVTEVVLRLSRGAGASLVGLTDAAREELRALAAGGSAAVEELTAAAAP